MFKRNFLDGPARVQAEREARAHYARERGDENALLEVKFLDRGLFLLLGHLPLLGHACHPGHGDSGHAHEHPEEDDQPGHRGQNLSEQLTMEDRRDQRAERCGIAEGHRHSQRHAEVAHGQPEGQTAHPPQDPEEVGTEQGRARRLADDRRQVAVHDQPQKPGGDDPAKETTRQPVSFPGPLADEPVRDVKAARGQPAEPVEDNAEERIGGHGGGCEWLVASGKRLVASFERLVPGDFPMNSSPLATRNSSPATRNSFKTASPTPRPRSV